MLKLYTFGHGGKHRDNADANRWRFLTAHLAANIRQAHPHMDATAVHFSAKDEASRVTRQLNDAEVERTLGA
jgi:hypothetical protein